MKIIKITAIWCTSCIIVNNHLDELKKEFDFQTINYDYDYSPEVENYNVGKILPVLIFIDENNNEIKRFIGEKNKKELINILEEMGNRNV